MEIVCAPKGYRGFESPTLRRKKQFIAESTTATVSVSVSANGHGYSDSYQLTVSVRAGTEILAMVHNQLKFHDIFQAGCLGSKQARTRVLI